MEAVNDFLTKLRMLTKSFFQLEVAAIDARLVLHSIKRLVIMRKLLHKISPKIALFHCGSYGGADALLIRLCKEMGIATAEFQHGYVGKYHLAYNYALKKDVYSLYLPDYFLTFGNYWSSQLARYPNKKIVIGSPEMRFQLSEHQGIPTKNQILIVSQGAFTSKFVDLTRDLRNRLPKRVRIVFRLHPGEVPFEERYSSLYGKDGITVDKHSNIFDLIKSSRAVVGLYSTTLFEALPFRKPVYVLKTPLSDAYIPQQLGRRFSSAAELVDLILSDSDDDLYDNWMDYWELDWEPRFKDFLTTIGMN